jgi:translation initiation factor 2 beta subunit (eIF-2beta)/eIF-5
MVIEHIVETIVGEDNTVSGLRCPKCGAHWAIHEV